MDNSKMEIICRIVWYLIPGCKITLFLKNIKHSLS